ncbi:hypothetical protein V866_006948 [Kwoniella sp. B9012]
MTGKRLDIPTRQNPSRGSKSKAESKPAEKKAEKPKPKPKSKSKPPVSDVQTKDTPTPKKNAPIRQTYAQFPGPFARIWLDSMKENDPIWSSKENIKKFEQSFGVSLQPFEHSLDQLFPSVAVKFEFIRFKDKTQSSTLPRMGRGPVCGVDGSLQRCHQAQPFVPSFLYIHPEAICDKATHFGLPTLIFRWEVKTVKISDTRSLTELILYSCWSCYTRGGQGCTVLGKRISETSDENVSQLDFSEFADDGDSTGPIPLPQDQPEVDNASDNELESEENTSPVGSFKRPASPPSSASAFKKIRMDSEPVLSLPATPTPASKSNVSSADKTLVPLGKKGRDYFANLKKKRNASPSPPPEVKTAELLRSKPKSAHSSDFFLHPMKPFALPTQPSKPPKNDKSNEQPAESKSESTATAIEPASSSSLLSVSAELKSYFQQSMQATSSLHKDLQSKSRSFELGLDKLLSEVEQFKTQAQIDRASIEAVRMDRDNKLSELRIMDTVVSTQSKDLKDMQKKIGLLEKEITLKDKEIENLKSSQKVFEGRIAGAVEERVAAEKAMSIAEEHRVEAEGALRDVIAECDSLHKEIEKLKESDTERRKRAQSF